MGAYTVRFDHLDGDTTVGPRCVDGDTPADLAQAVHRHARGILGSRRIDIHLDQETLTGTVLQAGSLIGAFTLDPTAPTPDPHEEHTGIRWGYTLHTLDALTRTAIRRNSAYYACDTSERYAAAWHAAVELLYTTVTRPARHDLIRAAWYAADAHTLKTSEQRGIPRSRGECYTGRTDMPRWHAYWETVARHTASPEEPAVERLALAQIWPRLTPGQQTALSALAAYDDYQAAADALGLSRGAFYRRITSARSRVLALWWEGETPRRGWRDRRAAAEPAQLRSASAHIRKRARAGVAT